MSYEYNATNRPFEVGQKGMFHFIGGPLDGNDEEIPLAWFRLCYQGRMYRLAMQMTGDPEMPARWVCVEDKQIDKEDK